MSEPTLAPTPNSAQPTWPVPDLLSHFGSITPQRIPNKGTGVVATKSIPQGTTILIERPFLPWPRGTYDAAGQTANVIRLHHTTPTSLNQLANMFPATMEDIPEAWRKDLDTHATEVLDILTKDLDTASTATSSTIPYLFTRLYNVLECNAYPSGLPPNLALVNHACNPNCLVLEQEVPQPPSTDPSSSSWFPGLIDYNLVTSRDIEAGEELTVSYLERWRTILLATDRKRMLQEKYMFDCQCDMCCSSSGGKETAGSDPAKEDYLCSYCSGSIGPTSGLCKGCGRQLTDRELFKIEDKALDVILALRKTVENAYGAIDSSDRPKLDRLFIKLVEGRAKAHALLHPTHLALEVVNRCIKEVAEIRQ